MIKTARLRLRPLRTEDAHLLPTLITPMIGAQTANWIYPFATTMAEERVTQALTANAAGRAFNRLIESRTAAVPMGWLGMVLLDGSQQAGRRIGSLGYWLTDTFHGKGYLTEALAAFVPAAVTALRLQRLEAGAQPQNAASIAALTRLGLRFTEERLHFVPARNREEPTAFFARNL